MSIEQRLDIRHWCSQKAVLLTEEGAGNLSVITNLSNGGLCLAVVGSARRWKNDRIDLKVNDRTFLCNIVSRGKEGFHCSFENQNFESVSEKRPKFSHIVARNEIISIDDVHQFSASPYNGADKHHMMWRIENNVFGNSQKNYQLCFIYTEGCFTGREQIDTIIDALDATADVLNPYRTPEKRECWAQGFKDAVRHAAKYRNPPDRSCVPS